MFELKPTPSFQLFRAGPFFIHDKISFSMIYLSKWKTFSNERQIQFSLIIKKMLKSGSTRKFRRSTEKTFVGKLSKIDKALFLKFHGLFCTSD